MTLEEELAEALCKAMPHPGGGSLIGYEEALEAATSALKSIYEFGWAGDAQATTFYATREEAEEFMGNPRQFRRVKAGDWEEVNPDLITKDDVGPVTYTSQEADITPGSEEDLIRREQNHSMDRTAMPQGTDTDMDDIEIIRAWLAPDPKNWPALEALDRLEKSRKEEKAKAWDEGQQAGWVEGYSHGEPEENPYRRTE